MSTSSRWHQPHTRRWAFAELIALSSLVLGAVGSGVASASTGTTETVGFAFSYTKPGAGAMADAGYDFAIGYVSNNPAKNLTAGQVAAYRDAGIHVGLVWETTEGRALEGRAAGAEDGRAAENQADILDYPDGAVIFFAVDTNTTTADYPAIKAYAQAFNQATRRPVGIFGEADVLDHFVRGGRSTVQYGWQTSAWSHGRVSERADLYKRVGHPSRPVPDGISPRAFDEVVAIQSVPLAR